jgi:hypothetical protein
VRVFTTRCKKETVLPFMATQEVFLIENTATGQVSIDARNALVAELNKGSPPSAPRFKIATMADLRSAWENGADWCSAGFASGGPGASTGGYPINAAWSAGNPWCNGEAHKLTDTWGASVANTLVVGVKPVPGESVPPSATYRVRWSQGGPEFGWVELDLNGAGTWNYKISRFNHVRYLARPNDELRRVFKLSDVRVSNMASELSIGVDKQDIDAYTGMLVVGILLMVVAVVGELYFLYKKRATPARLPSSSFVSSSNELSETAPQYAEYGTVGNSLPSFNASTFS